MRLETERLLLRPWRKTDLDAYSALMGDPTVRRFYPSTLTREDAARSLDRTISAHRENGFHFLAAELRETGEIAGLIGLGRIPDATKKAIPSHPEIEIGWLLHHRLWGQGLAPEGAKACLAYGWDTLEAPEIVAFTAKVNHPSQRVMEKIGMARAPEDDFIHPSVPDGHVLQPHTLYRIVRPC
ncbi:GNAT family N-acetyltransferase [Pelagibacterium xiamenense]|uniref:GNAT family N-acetyltransferase n=1 Tax=Pelagibacterium xiamenense TaxID=2901140 RepID=UPI001E3A6208|nr:GNAT family N-acetyltransferase [Pelagibacterium xiamenense]MCD7060090.1 GNAT family N-acetyltransferase [Pelagibacterium xiamenense]